MYGQNDGIPAFRFYDRLAQKVVTCNAPAGVQYIRDRIHAPGALAGGSSYVNLLDGDAQHVALTVATRDRMSVFRRLGGWRMAALLAAHPVRVARMALQGVAEWLREEWERTAGELARRRTHSEGLFPFVRILTNVVVRELQTMGILLDAHLGVPAIYSTFMQYDELAHHFGPSSWQALRDLRRTDKRIGEIKRLLETAAGRPYDLVVLSDHGMTPAASYRVLYGETLGTTVQRILDGDALRAGERRPELHAVESGSETSEYATVGPQVVEAVVQAQPLRRKRRRKVLRRFRDWLARAYGLRGLLLPEKYLDDPGREVVVTYSSDLALLYFATSLERMELGEIVRERRRAALYQSLLEHPGIGLIAALSGPAVHLESARGRAVLVEGTLEVVAGENPLAPYGTERPLLRAVERLVRQPNAGDLVIFGAYDGYEIVSFDDQIGAHGAAGGNQLYPFIIGPRSMRLDTATIEDARDLHPLLFGDR